MRLHPAVLLRLHFYVHLVVVISGIFFGTVSEPELYIILHQESHGSIQKIPKRLFPSVRTTEGKLLQLAKLFAPDQPFVVLLYPEAGILRIELTGHAFRTCKVFENALLCRAR